MTLRPMFIRQRQISTQFVRGRPPDLARHTPKGKKPDPSWILLTSLAMVYFAISVTLIIPHATAELSSETIDQSPASPSTAISDQLSDDQLIRVSTIQADQQSSKDPDSRVSDETLVEEFSGDGADELSSGDGDDAVMTSREIKAIDLEILKRQFLRQMGLNGRPPLANSHGSALPVYLWDIYENVAEGMTLSSTADLAKVSENRNGYEDDGNENGPLYTSAARSYFDTVRTFFATGNPLWPTTLLFDMNRLPSNERWVEAELRVPWHSLLADMSNVSKSGLVLNESLSRPINETDAISDNEFRRKHFVRINLYEVVNETVDIRHLIDTKLISAATSRYWASFDVLSVVSRASTNSNILKLGVELVTATSYHVSEEHADQSIFLRITDNRTRDIERSAALIMYGFDDDGKEKPIKYKNLYKHYLENADDSGGERRSWRRKRRAKRNRHRTSGRPRLRGSDVANRHHSSSGRRGNQNQNLCLRRPLVIRFEDLNWQDWILAPQEYTAYYCSGQCSYPFSDGQNTTNHAIVQALVNSVSPRTAPRPCCVPTETSSISMLYTDIDRNIVIKNYPDMIVEGCGCR